MMGKLILLPIFGGFFISLCLAAPPYAGHGGYALSYLTEGNGVASKNTINWPTEAFTTELWLQNPAAELTLERLFAFRSLSGSPPGQLAVHTQSVQGAFWIGTTPTVNLGAGFFTTLSNEAMHVAVVWTNTGPDSSDVDIFINGELAVSVPYSKNYIATSPDGWLLAGWSVKNLSADPRYNMIGVIDELRFWEGARSEEQIKDNMYRVLKPENNPDLIGYYRFTDGLFDEGVFHGDVPNDADHATLDLGDLEEKTWSGDGQATYAETQLEIKPGYGLPTYTDLAVEAKPGSYFEFPLVGGDSDGDELVFVLDAVPEEVEFFTGTLESVGGAIELNTTFPLNENGGIIGQVGEGVTVDGVVELMIEYHAVEYFIVANGESSLKTEAYMNLTVPEESNLIQILAVAGGAGLVAIVVGVFIARRGRGDGNSGNGGKRLTNGSGGTSTSGLTSTSGVTVASAGSDVSAASNVEKAIALILDEFDVPSLNRYVAHMISEGVGEPALALALAVEEAAVGMSADVYLAAVENVGAAMAATGRDEAIDEVKTARRTTMAMKGSNTKIAEGQLQSKKMKKVRAHVKKRAKKVRVADAGGTEVWNRKTIRETAGQLQPISMFMDDSDSFRVSINSTMAPDF